VPGLRPRRQPSLAVAYVAFAHLGLTTGVGGVLLPAQIADYGVGRATIGICFLMFAAGFILASFSTGGALARLGIRTTLAAGGLGMVLAWLGLASRPPFTVFVALQLAIGYGTGLVESALNAHLTGLPGSTTLLNRLHAFFGLGALVGPLLAAWMLGAVAWPRVWLVLALLYLPLVVGFAACYPARTRPVPHVSTAPAGRRGLVADALRQPGVALAAVFLAVYVGLEQSVGSWGFSLLVGTRGLSPLMAGYAVSGFWLGLTAGRFLIGPIAARTGRTAAELAFACLGGVAVMVLLAWLGPTTASAFCGFVLLGACLGPVFPTTMALTPSFAEARLVPTAIGIVNGVSVVGGALVPWLAGAVAQGLGIWTLLPFCLVLSMVQLGVWWLVTARMAAPDNVDTAGVVGPVPAADDPAVR
jgi:fucose permease